MRHAKGPQVVLQGKVMRQAKHLRYEARDRKAFNRGGIAEGEEKASPNYPLYFFKGGVD